MLATPWPDRKPGCLFLAAPYAGRVILHLLTATDWSRLRSDTTLSPASLATEGFVHCTGDDDTLLAVANRFYTTVDETMVVISLDVARLTASVKWEPPAHPDGRAAAPDDPLFPHVYGPLELAAVRVVRSAERTPEGTFTGFGAPLPLAGD